MAMLSRDEAQAILAKVLSYSRAEACQASLNGSTTGNIRYARNTVTTSGSVSDLSLVVESRFGQRSGTATINELDDASLEKVVRRSEELARLAPENPELMPPLGPQRYLEVRGWYEATAAIDPAYRARAAAASIEPSLARKLVAAGYLEDSAGFQAIANSAELFAHYPSTQAEFSVTVRSADDTGSGYAQRNVHDAALLDTGTASAIAIEKALRSQEPRAIDPGKYTVILEPAASAGLLQFMTFSFDARQADEGRSFLARPGGGTRLGEKLFDERVTLYSDPMHPKVPGSPFAGDGLPRGRVVWVEGGVVRTLITSRYWASRTETEPVPFPANGIMEGGSASLEDLIKDTRKGILVTRTWYIRTVDPQTLLLTGLTRDGCFYIEDGTIAFPVKNMRFNESPVIMLNNIEALGRPERIDNTLIPPMKIRDFTFTSLSDAV